MAVDDVFPILTSADLPRLLPFYTDVLGGELVYQFPPEGAPAYVSVQFGKASVGLGHDPEFARTAGRPPIALWLYTDDLDATRRGDPGSRRADHPGADRPAVGRARGPRRGPGRRPPARPAGPVAPRPPTSAPRCRPSGARAVVSWTHSAPLAVDDGARDVLALALRHERVRVLADCASPGHRRGSRRSPVPSDVSGGCRRQAGIRWVTDRALTAFVVGGTMFLCPVVGAIRAPIDRRVRQDGSGARSRK